MVFYLLSEECRLDTPKIYCYKNFYKMHFKFYDMDPLYPTRIGWKPFRDL